MIERWETLENKDFEKVIKQNIYVLSYYDAFFQKETPLIDAAINGIVTANLEKSMIEIDWKNAFDFDTKKQLNFEDKTSWEKEQKVESVIEGLSELEKSEDGKVVAIGLKLKYWSGISYQELFRNISPLRNKSEVSQRFIFLKAKQAYQWMRRIDFCKIVGWKNRCRQKENKRIVQKLTNQEKTATLHLEADC